MGFELTLHSSSIYGREESVVCNQFVVFEPHSSANGAPISPYCREEKLRQEG